jgi:hypothetical protein
MKKKVPPMLTTVATSYKIPDKDIIQMMYELRANFLMNFGKEPNGWIISAQDYMCLIERVKTFGAYTEFHYSLAYPNQFMGLPIRLKRSGPLELEVDVFDWARYAMGTVK